MHTIIICGTPWCEVKAIQQIIEVAGVATASPASSGSVTNIFDWHGRLFSSQPDPASAIRVGKAWELAASQIFLSNWDLPVWGWADSRSTWLLDFWRDFDAGTRFILVYTPPQTVLTRVLTDVSSGYFDATAILDQWCTDQTELLKFFHRNRNRCILLNADQALAAPCSLVSNINEQFQLNLHAPLNYLDKTENIKPLDQWLVQQLLQLHPEARALEQEIQASLPALQNAEQIGLLPPKVSPTPETAAAQLRQLYQQQADLRIAKDRQAEQLGALQNQTQQQQHALQEQGQENELLLVQLHQVQEELENNFLQSQILREQKSEFEQARDVDAKEKSEGITQRGALQQDNASLHNQIQNLQQTQQDIQQENKVLLLQLHQVQEELEHFILQHQQGKQMHQVHWSRLTSQYPEYCEWDRIVVLTATESAHWQVHGLMAIGRTLPLIEVSLDLTNDTPVLSLYPPAQLTDAYLLHWTRQDGKLTNVPLQILRVQLDAEPGSVGRETLRRLAPTDLLLLQSICRALFLGLPSTQPDREVLVQHLQDLQTQLKQLPATWRFDAAQLKNEQVNPGYEHLCFSLKNARFGDRQWPEFEFCIGAAQVKKDKFSMLPRLEFPLPAKGNKQFENWFEESEDELGPKFELRFDIKKNAIDINAWQALNATDQMQVLSIIANLPQLMSQVEQQGAIISRKWDDWQHLVTSMQETLQSLGLPAKTFEIV